MRMDVSWEVSRRDEQGQPIDFARRKKEPPVRTSASQRK